ncbi:MAG TPA: response regulator, partial [Thermodesulfovibrionia bacterium]|nr:response regulator [Thermodesulfovibrionia bacterium]
LDRFFGIYDTGLTRIMGGRGKIEETLNEVFLKNLLPQCNTWVDYGRRDSSKTEKALLRFTLNHLMQLLDDDGDQCFPEEVYLYPPLSDGIKTGSIVVKKKNKDSLCVVMNPACDLVVRNNGDFKTDRILLVEIEPVNVVLDSALSGITKKDRQKSKLETVMKNNHTGYFHWLPATNYFMGGFINFRKISTLTKEQFVNEFNNPVIQISPSFVKDIVSRFSSYYARQGQPDIEFANIINKMISS